MNRDGFDKRVWPVVLAHEGGYNDDPDDGGGATNWGVSLRYLQSLPKWVGDVNDDGFVDARDIRELTQKQARDIYWRMWQGLGYNRWMGREEAHAPVMIKLFDVAVNTGARRAAVTLQRATWAASLGDFPLVDDGLIGPNTKGAVLGTLGRSGAMRYREGPARMLAALCAVQAAFYRDIATGKNRKFLRGWLRRAHWAP